MTPVPHLRLIDEHGQVVEAQAERGELARLNAETARLTSELADAEKDLRGKRAQIRRLLANKEAERLGHEQRAVIEELHDLWQQRTGKLRSPLTGDRFDAVVSALKHYSVEQVRLAIVGAGAFPYVKNHAGLIGRWAEGPKAEWFADLELVCRVDGKGGARRFELLANLGAGVRGD